MQYCMQTPLGPMLLKEDNGALAVARFAPEETISTGEPPTPLLTKTVQQLQEYFAGQRKSFDIPLQPNCTLYQTWVWEEMNKVPYGETTTYGALAAAIGRPKATRAIGSACRYNPIAIIQPCHRVVGSNPSSGGYSGGMHIKNFLLELEQKYK